MMFYLGTHMPSWLDVAPYPLMVSHRRLAGRKTFPRALHPWVLDSGGFTELNLHGADAYAEGARPYVAAARRYADQIGKLDWAAPQDWMCEPFVLDKTGLTVADHQQRTTDNLLELRHAAPDLPWIPVLQGFAAADYLNHADQYAAAGIDLTVEPTVGVGSVCRRQNTGEVAHILELVASLGIRLHGFGCKGDGLRTYAAHLTSADSMSWSFRARRDRTLPGCTGHKSCANCLRYATRWRDRALQGTEYHQPSIFEGAA
jgi:hypothetical protein